MGLNTLWQHGLASRPDIYEMASSLPPGGSGLKRFAKALDHPAPWKDESLLRRPEKEDSPSRRRGHGQKRGGANLGGQPLFDQTLRWYGTPGEVSHSEEASRLAPEDRRARQEAPSSGPQRATGRYPPATPRVPAAHGGQGSQRLAFLPRHKD